MIDERSPRVEVYRDADGGWRWRYVERDGGFVLDSNKDYDSREDALAAARRAYPDAEGADD